MKNHEVPAGHQAPTPTGPVISPGNTGPTVLVPTEPQTVVLPVEEPAAPNAVIGGNMRQDQVSQDHVDTTIERTVTHREIL